MSFRSFFPHPADHYDNFRSKLFFPYFSPRLMTSNDFNDAMTFIFRQKQLFLRMKTIGTILAATLVIFPWCLTPLFGQQPAESDKKIVITKRIVSPDGTETVETIIKKGQAAEDFDALNYLRENEADNTDIEIREEADQGNFVRITTSDAGDDDHHEVLVVNWDEINEDLQEALQETGVAVRGLGRDFHGVIAAAPFDDKRGFLGVQEDSDEDPEAEGLVVEIVRGSAAEKAGLKNNDLILSLNDTKTNRWSDLTAFMISSKPGDEVRIAYKRAGAAANTTATLTKRSEVKSSCEVEKHGFLGISPDGDDEEDAVGVRVDVIDETGASAAGLQDGDEITKMNDTEIRDWDDIEDFMSDTKTGDKVIVGYLRNGTAGTVEATLGEQRSVTAWSSGQNWNWNKDWSNDFEVNVREKPACLGVYSGSWTEGEQKGSQVSSFTTESAARDASMQVGDVITSVNSQAVEGHDQLWNEIAKYQPGDKVSVAFLRENSPQTIEATLKACRDQSRVTVIGTDENGPSEQRRFYAWSWGDNEQERLRTRRVITIHKGQEGDAAQPAAQPTTPPAQDRTLQLQAFRAFPNPTAGQITVAFRGEAVPTVITLLDMSGRQLFREELNAFNGDYNQQFDLSEYAKGTILIQVTQNGKVFTEQVVVN